MKIFVNLFVIFLASNVGEILVMLFAMLLSIAITTCSDSNSMG